MSCLLDEQLIGLNKVQGCILRQNVYKIFCLNMHSQWRFLLSALRVCNKVAVEVCNDNRSV